MIEIEGSDRLRIVGSSGLPSIHVVRYAFDPFSGMLRSGNTYHIAGSGPVDYLEQQSGFVYVYRLNDKKTAGVSPVLEIPSRNVADFLDNNPGVYSFESFDRCDDLVKWRDALLDYAKGFGSHLYESLDFRMKDEITESAIRGEQLRSFVELGLINGGIDPKNLPPLHIDVYTSDSGETREDPEPAVA